MHNDKILREKSRGGRKLAASGTGLLTYAAGRPKASAAAAGGAAGEEAELKMAAIGIGLLKFEEAAARPKAAAAAAAAAAAVAGAAAGEAGLKMGTGKNFGHRSGKERKIKGTGKNFGNRSGKERKNNGTGDDFGKRSGKERKAKDHEQKEKMFELREAKCQENRGELEKKLKRNTEFQTYQMSKRGICLIINNFQFHDRTMDRAGAEIDGTELKLLFEELGFTVIPYDNLQSDEMLKIAAEFAKKGHSEFNAFIFIVMSHGGSNDVISGVNGEHIKIEALMSKFKATNCPTLQNKPKMFFIQACRGSMQEGSAPTSDCDSAADFSTDSTLPRSVCPQEADFLLSFATAPGFVAYRNQCGSRFIQFLVGAIRDYHHSHHLLDILTEVNRRVVEDGIQKGNTIQCPALTHTLQAQVYF